MNPVVVDIDELRRLITEAAGPPLMTRKEVATLLRIHVRDLRRLVLEGVFPPGIKLGRRVRWRRKTVERWLDRAEKNRLHGPTMTAAQRPAP